MSSESCAAQASESWFNRGFELFATWFPYLSLALSLLLGMAFQQPNTNVPLMVGLAIAAGVWTFMAFTLPHRRTPVGQVSVRFYFIGFILLAFSLVAVHPIFLIYGITGFLHAQFLQPVGFVVPAVGLTSAVVHYPIVADGGDPAMWSIFGVVVALQTVLISAGNVWSTKLEEMSENRRQTVERLEATLEENAGLHAQLVSQAHEAGVHDERQRMAREIHDTLAQGLTGVIMQLEAARHASHNTAELERHLENASRLARDSLDEARRSVLHIRPRPLENTRLPEALSDVATRWSDLNGVDVNVTTTGDTQAIHPEVEVTLLRVAQEGLTNIGKHASATRAGVTLSFMDDLVALDVRDDGTGFDTSTNGNGFGLTSMRQRVEGLKGTFNVESGESGTAISVTIPVAHE